MTNKEIVNKLRTIRDNLIEIMEEDTIFETKNYDDLEVAYQKVLKSIESIRHYDYTNKER